MSEITPPSTPRPHHASIVTIIRDRLFSANTAASIGLLASSAWVCRYPQRARQLWRWLEGRRGA